MNAPLSTRAQHDHVMTPNYVPAQFVPVRGEGVRVWDQEGQRYLDLTSGIAVTALGHAHPALIEALTTQAKKIWHVSGWFTNEPVVALAQALTEATFAERAFFCNSGAEANEAALKLARRYAFDHVGEKKHRIISTHNAFHGRTLFTVTAGGTEKYKLGFGPLPQGITHIPYNDSDALRAVMDDTVCAVIIEPIQGEGGIRSATPEFLKTARELCDQYQALLILDEVQTGVGRTGTLYNYMQKGITPDILTTAKGLGGGFPIAGMLTTTKIATSLAPGTHGTTYGGNPLACAVAKAVLDHVNTPSLYANVKARHVQFKAGLEAIGQRLGCFAEIRGEGLLIAAELADVLHDQAQTLMQIGQRHHVLFLMAGYNVLRFAPALIIQEEEVQEGLERIEATLKEALQTASIPSA
jgi:acetylornithine/N-succinyldiaminopimelate aminotransferase